MSQEIIKDRSEEFSELLMKTKKKHPREEDVIAFRKLIYSDVKFFASLCPLAETTANSILTRVTDDPGSKEVLRANMLAIREELGYSEAPPFERALIDHVALCWLRLQLTEQWYSEKTLQETHTFEAVLYFDKRHAGAQKRYLRAIETLARVRRLTRGFTIVNVAAPGGQQQVNQLFHNT